MSGGQDPNIIGTLVIVVLKARNLRDKHSFYKQDAYSVVSLNGEPKRTAIDVKGGQHPVWDEEIRFQIHKNTNEKYRSLKVECWSKEPRTDDMLASGKVDISETLKTGEFDDWVQLYEPSGQARGDLYLEMTYYRTGPAPINRRPSKLHPNDRLFRPPHSPPRSTHTSASPPRNQQPQRRPHQHHTSASVSASPPRRPTSPTGGHLLPRSSRSPSRTPKDHNAPLPPIPHDLTPGGGHQPGAQSVPAILLPGRGSAQTHASYTAPVPETHPVPPENPIHARYPPASTSSPPRRTNDLPASLQPSAYGPAPAPAPVPEPEPRTNGLAFPMPTMQTSASYGATPGTYGSYQPAYAPALAPDMAPGYVRPRQLSYTPPQAQPPAAYVRPRNLSYVPPSAAQVPVPAQPPYASYISHSPPSFVSPPPVPGFGGQGPASDLPDPYLQARYSSPLPLPPQPGQSQAQYQPPMAFPPDLSTRTESTPRPAGGHTQNQTPTPANPPLPARKTDEESIREEAERLDREEEEGRRRQEEEDEELARRLDREFNAQEAEAGEGEERRGRGGMPGAW